MHVKCRPSRGVGHGTACARNRFLAGDDPRYSQYSRFLCSLQPKCAVASRNPPLPSHPPTTPFDKIFADYFDYAGRHFLIVGDRLSGWSDVFGTPAGTTVTGANALVRLLQSYFGPFRVPEEISSDVGSEFTAFVTQDFTGKWGIKHRVSSAYFPQSNGRAEVAVKAAKRFLMSNISPNGDLNNDSFLRALLQLRYTSDPDCDLSPAEIVFGHSLRDAFSFVNRLATFSNRFICRTWREAWRAKEDALRVRAKRTNDALRARTRLLRPLRCGDRVFIQNQGGKDTYVNGTKSAPWSKHWISTNIMLKWEDPVV